MSSAIPAEKSASPGRVPASWPCAPSLAGSCLGKHGLGFISQQLGLGQ